MRSMSMLQLLGGVAVAGAVAAGTTAFTAGSGLDNTAVANKVIGGRAAITVSGATMTSATFTVDSTNSHEDHVMGVDLVIKDDSNVAITSGVVVTAAFTGTPTGVGTPASGTAITCTYSSGWHCNAGLDTTHYYTGVTSVAVTVV